MSANNDTREVVIQGIGVSPGIVAGKAFLLTTDDERYVAREVEEDEIPREMARFEDALIETRRQIHDIQQKVSDAVGQDSAGIFDAHLMVVDDRAFVEEVIRELTARRRNVEVVLKDVAEKYAEALANIEDDYLRERAADVRDVARRILRNLSGKTSSQLQDLTEPCIVVANDLAPSDTATMNTEKVIGFVTDLGSHTSHTAIMARALGIPAIVGLHDVSLRVSEGDPVMIDGGKGLFFIHPTSDRLSSYNKLIESRRTIESELALLKDEPPETKDGYFVLLSANIELPSDIDSVIESGARGVGLFRSEFIYLSQDALPNEEEQFKAYEEVARRLSPHPVIIRTLDLGGDKFISHIRTLTELNPFMGWRAIRFCLAQPAIFKTQLRALLRASKHENVKLMYPMVSNVNEVLQANEILDQVRNELRREGHEFNENIDVGVMIEVPSAALTADLIAPHVDFFSIGTNDLIQYTLAVDRVNERIAYLYEPTHPAIIKLIRNTIDVAHRNGIWTGICGEMAGNPLMVPLLVGLGADELSMNPGSIPMAKDVIRNLTYSQAETLAEQTLASESATEVLDLCRSLTQKIAPEVLELVE